MPKNIYISSDGAVVEASDGGGQTAVATIAASGSNPAGYGGYGNSLTRVGGFAVFAAPDTNGAADLWSTDGTQLAAIVLANASPYSQVFTPPSASPSEASIYGLTPALTRAATFPTLDGKVYFSAVNSLGRRGLWASDGTSAGTAQVGTTNQGAYDLDPYAMLAFGRCLIFDGENNSGDDELYIYDDISDAFSPIYFRPLMYLTPSSTPVMVGDYLFYEYGVGAAGAQGIEVFDSSLVETDVYGSLNSLTFVDANSPSGNGSVTRNAANLTAFGGELVFTATDASGRNALWSSDGLSNSAEEFFSDAQSSVDLAPANLMALQNLVVFTGLDASGKSGLWATDGTTSGTAEIAAGVALQSPYYRFGADLLFQAGAALWITDGTAAGTKQLVSVNSSTPGDVTSDFGVVDFGDKAIVYSDLGIWATDGTAAGTVLLMNVPYYPYHSGSVYYELPSDFHVAGAQMWFEDNSSIYVTDGTAAGTQDMYNNIYTSVTVVGGKLAQTSSSNVVLGAAANDYNGDGVSDLIWQSASGDVYGWDMLGGRHVGDNSYGDQAGLAILGAGSFDGSAYSGLLLQSKTTGATYEWQMNNGSHVNTVALGDLAGWSATLGNFEGDAATDILWQNDSSGEVWLWTFQQGQHTASTDFANLQGWKAIGSGDFNGDGTADVLWQNTTSGEVYEWTMQGGQQKTSVDLGNLTGWTMLGSGDFNGDGIADLLWQNNTSGQVYEWLLNSAGARAASVDLGVEQGYSVVSIGDYQGAGTSGIVWQGAAGDVWEWTMSNGQLSASAYLGSLSGWKGT